jgi:hypothetical protein
MIINLKYNINVLTIKKMYKFRIALLMAFLVGFLFSSCSSSRHTTTQAKPKSVYYSCLMHSEVIEMNPGKCPKCGMKMEAFDMADLKLKNSGSSYNPINSGGSSGAHSGGHH